MIRSVKLYSNSSELSNEILTKITSILNSNGIDIVNENYDLAIAIGGDGTFLRMIKDNNFNDQILYTGINTGSLGFLQKVSVDKLDTFINKLKDDSYSIDYLDVLEAKIYSNNQEEYIYSLNEMLIREVNLDTLRLSVLINNELLENFVGDGLMISTTSGSTGYNLCYNGSIVYNSLKAIQITPLAPLNSNAYRNILNSVIVPNNTAVSLRISQKKNNILITSDGENSVYENVDRLEMTSGHKNIKCLNIDNYSITKIINEKFTK